MNKIRLTLGLALSFLLLAGTSFAHDSQHSDAASESEAPPAGQHMMGEGHSQGMMGQGMMGQEMPMMPGMRSLMMPQMDSARGRKLFASKGCVACHAINGVGGHDATALDAHTMGAVMNPFDFAAKMWRMAPAMIYAQEEALGTQILFTGDEFADIVAFVHDDEEQHNFTEADIPANVRKMMHHSHGEPGGGTMMHKEELGHHDMHTKEGEESNGQ